ncbi:Auxin-induced protein 5NG4 [Hordeum vulgare]|nr:Auxin-induced protein 5NG4 [Hordeum vulgare]
MQFYSLSYCLSATVLEMRYPIGVIMEDTLRVWAISRWRRPMELANVFLATGYHHLARSSSGMFCVEEVRANGLVIGFITRFTNHFDTYFLLAKVFWCGCEFITFTTHNIFTNFNNIFSTLEGVHTLSYIFPEDEE